MRNSNLNVPQALQPSRYQRDKCGFYQAESMIAMSSLKAPASKDACGTLIRNCTINDAEAIAGIYNYYIKNTTITFEEAPVTPTEMEERIKTVTQKYPWLVYEDKGKIIGYAYAGEFKSRCAYRFTIESSVYLDSSSHRKGIGSALYMELIKRLKQQKIHSIVGVIAVPNERSIRLHRKFGFEKAGALREVGYKFGRWIDVEYWQLKL